MEEIIFPNQIRMYRRLRGRSMQELADHLNVSLSAISKIEKVIVSGPKRELIEKTNLDWHHAAPGGDVMMTGTVGLIKTALG